MKVGYVRVSTDGQHTSRQDALMVEMGVDRVYTDKMSGKDTNRPQLQEMLKFVRDGDIVVAESISRIARSTKDFLNIMEKLKEKNVSFVSKKEQIDTSTPQGVFMTTVFSALAELERNVTKQRVQEGIAEAKKRGVYKGRKPLEVDGNKFRQLYSEWKANKITAVKAYKTLGLSASTFYRRVREYESKRA